MTSISFLLSWAANLKNDLAEVNLILQKDMHPKKLTIREDEAFRLSINSSEINKYNCNIYIGDIIIDLHESFNSKLIIESQLKKHLENYFGHCSIRIEILETGIIYYPLELNVLAKKITADQAKEIISYLNEKEEDVLRYCFSSTHLKSNASEEKHDDPIIILQKAENLLNNIAKHRIYFKQHGHSRLIPKQKYAPREKSRHIDDTSIVWLFSNFDQLTSSDDLDYDVLFKGKKFRIGSISSQELVADTDVYENRVIYSLLHSIRVKLTFYLNEARVINSENDLLAGYNDYFSIESVMSNVLPICGLWQARCKNLILQSKVLMDFMNQAIPCKLEFGLKPFITPFVRSNYVYRNIFLMADSWYKSGAPTWQGQEFLVSLLSLPKLYEFYCLYMLLDGFENSKFKIETKDFREYIKDKTWRGVSMPRPEKLPFNYFKYYRDGLSMEFFYEPMIRSFSDFNEDKKLVEIRHKSPNHKYSYVSPDFLIRIENSQGKYSYLILDAKYSSDNTIVNFSIPNIVNKYLHGIVEVDKINNCLVRLPLVGLFAILPKIDRKSNINYINPDWINDRFGFLGIPVLPAVAGIEMSPKSSPIIEKLLENLLKFSGFNSTAEN